MPRTLLISNIVLVLVAAALAVLLHDAYSEIRELRRVAQQGLPASLAGGDALRDAQMPVGRLSASAADAQAISAQLARIERRLSALEPAGAGADPGADRDGRAAVDPATPTLSPADADRRLTQLLPGPSVGREQLDQYRARVAALPPADQLALDAALSRAINQDRLRLRL